MGWVHTACVESLVDCPVWQAVATEAPRKYIRVHVQDHVDAELCARADDRLDLLHVRRIDCPSAGGKGARPQDAKPDCVESPRGEVSSVGAAKGRLGVPFPRIRDVRRRFEDYVEPMEEPDAPQLIDKVARARVGLNPWVSSCSVVAVRVENGLSQLV
eukprot:scaffold102676_cov31-Tisochrysis_lutea.AAC.3